MPTATDRLRAEEWLVQTIPTHREAVAFIRRHHYARGASNTSTYRHGLYRDDPATAPLVGDLMGVALWIPPTKLAALTVSDEWTGVLCLSRLAVHPDAPRNAASFLLASSMRRLDRCRWPHLVTYADTGEGHTGAIYRATNWECVGEVSAGDTWRAPDGSMRGRKRGGRTMLARDMVAAGYERREDAPKVKFVHHAGRRST